MKLAAFFIQNINKSRNHKFSFQISYMIVHRNDLDKIVEGNYFINAEILISSQWLYVNLDRKRFMQVLKLLQDNLNSSKNFPENLFEFRLFYIRISYIFSDFGIPSKALLARPWIQYYIYENLSNSGQCNLCEHMRTVSIPELAKNESWRTQTHLVFTHWFDVSIFLINFFFFF